VNDTPNMLDAVRDVVAPLCAQLERAQQEAAAARAELVELRISEQASANLAEYGTAQAVDLRKRLEAAEQRATAAKQRTEAERARAERAEKRADEEWARAARLGERVDEEWARADRERARADGAAARIDELTGELTKQVARRRRWWRFGR